MNTIESDSGNFEKLTNLLSVGTQVVLHHKSGLMGKSGFFAEGNVDGIDVFAKHYCYQGDNEDDQEFGKGMWFSLKHVALFNDVVKPILNEPRNIHSRVIPVELVRPAAIVASPRSDHYATKVVAKIDKAFGVSELLGCRDQVHDKVQKGEKKVGQGMLMPKLDFEAMSFNRVLCNQGVGLDIATQVAVVRTAIELNTRLYDKGLRWGDWGKYQDNYLISVGSDGVKILLSDFDVVAFSDDGMKVLRSSYDNMYGEVREMLDTSIKADRSKRKEDYGRYFNLKYLWNALRPVNNERGVFWNTLFDYLGEKGGIDRAKWGLNVISGLEKSLDSGELREAEESLRRQYATDWLEVNKGVIAAGSGELLDPGLRRGMEADYVIRKDKYEKNLPGILTAAKDILLIFWDVKVDKRPGNIGMRDAVIWLKNNELPINPDSSVDYERVINLLNLAKYQVEGSLQDPLINKDDMLLAARVVTQILANQELVNFARVYLESIESANLRNKYDSSCEVLNAGFDEYKELEMLATTIDGGEVVTKNEVDLGAEEVNEIMQPDKAVPVIEGEDDSIARIERRLVELYGANWRDDLPEWLRDW